MIDPKSWPECDECAGEGYVTHATEDDDPLQLGVAREVSWSLVVIATIGLVGAIVIGVMRAWGWL